MKMQEILEIIFKHQRKIFFILLLTLVPVLVKNIVTPNTYKASTKIWIGRGESFTVSLTPVPLLSQYEEINSEIEIIRSRALAEKVFLKMKDHNLITSGIQKNRPFFLGQFLSKNPANYSDFIGDLQKRIEVEPIKGSNVIQVSFEDRDRERTSEVLKLIVASYIELHAEVHSLPMAESFFKDRIVKTKAKLDSLENIMQRYKKSNNIMDLPAQQTNLLTQINSFENDLAEIKKKILSQKNNLKKVQKLMQSDSMLILPMQEIAQYGTVKLLRQKIIELKLQRNMLMKYGPDYMPLQRLNQEIDLAQKELTQEIKKIIKEQKLYLNSLQAEKEALEFIVNGLKNKTQNLPEHALYLNRLNLAIQNYRDLYSLLLKKYEELKISEASDTRKVNIRPLYGKEITVKKTGPHKIKSTVLSLMFGLMVSFSLAFWIEYFNPTIKSEEEIKNVLQLPVLQIIPEVPH